MEHSKYLDISTSHVSANTMAWISEAPSGLGITVAPYVYGGFVSVPGEIDDLDQIDNAACPEDLKIVLRYAKTCNCAVVRFDADAEILSGLPRYDWETGAKTEPENRGLINHKAG